MNRIRISSNTHWEDEIGYSRLVKVGNIIKVAGTTAINGTTIVGKDDVYAQTIFIFQKIEQALIQVNASLADVVATRMYVTNMKFAEKVGKAHAVFFKDIRPVATMVAVTGLIHPELLVEIEVEAITA